jgi:hypothetical protein
MLLFMVCIVVYLRVQGDYFPLLNVLTLLLASQGIKLLARNAKFACVKCSCTETPTMVSSNYHQTTAETLHVKAYSFL